MSANTKASYYSWYMSADPRARVVAFQWWPAGEFESSMTMGKLHFMKRDEPGDVWEPAVEVGEMPWVMAQNVARGEGFHVEVAEEA